MFECVYIQAGFFTECMACILAWPQPVAGGGPALPVLCMKERAGFVTQTRIAGVFQACNT